MQLNQKSMRSLAIGLLIAAVLLVAFNAYQLSSTGAVKAGGTSAASAAVKPASLS